MGVEMFLEAGWWLGGDEAAAAIQESRCLFMWVKAINLCFKGSLRNIGGVCWG